MQQAFRECHGLQCGFCTPGFLTTITAYLRRQPRPDRRRRPARRSAGNLCRCTGYQNIVDVGAARRRDSARRSGRRRRRRDHPDVRRSRVQRVEDPRLVTGNGRYLDDLGHDALAAAFVRSPHAHARIVDIDVTDALDVDGRRRDLHLRGPRRPGRRAAAAADPAPGAARTAAPATRWPRTRSTTSARPSSMVVARDRYVAEDAGRADPASTTSCCRPSSGLDAARAAEHARARRRARTTSPRTWCRRSATPRPRSPPRRTRSTLDLDDRAQRLDADGGQGRLRPLGRRRRVACGSTPPPRPRPSVRAAIAAKLGLPLTKVEVITPDVGGGFGVKIMHPWPEEILVPWAAIRLGRAGEVDRGPARALHLLARTSAASSTQVEVGFDDDGRLLGPRRAVLARQRRLHAVRHHRPDRHLHPAARAVQARRLPGASSARSTPTP